MSDERWMNDPLIGQIARGKLYCAACGYDLTGLKSGRCPECGRRIIRDSFRSVTTRDPKSFAFRMKRLFLWTFDHSGKLFFGGMAFVILIAWLISRAKG
jgi:hypothetical protein